jgi:integrase
MRPNAHIVKKDGGWYFRPPKRLLPFAHSSWEHIGSARSLTVQQVRNFRDRRLRELEAEALKPRHEQLRNRKTLGDALNRSITIRRDEGVQMRPIQEQMVWISKNVDTTILLDEISVEWLYELREKRLADGVKNTTCNRTMEQVRYALRLAERFGWLLRAPQVPMLSEVNSIRADDVALSRSQERRLLEELPPHLAAMCAFTLQTGLRAGNVRLLTWGEVHLNDGQIHIPADKMKSGRPHVVALTETAQGLILAQMNIHPEFVFTFAGEPVSRMSTRAWRKALQRAGCPAIRWHDLRHTVATRALQAGMTERKLMRFMDWTSREMVSRYEHLSSDDVGDLSFLEQ